MFLAACGGGTDRGTDRGPVANPASVSTLEETTYYGQLSGSGSSGPALDFALAAAPAHGTVELDRGTGRFTYLPATDVLGTDQFSFTVSDGVRTSAPAVVTIRIENVNDAPRIAAVPVLTNSPDAEWTYYDLDVRDPDREIPRLTVEVADPQRADVQFDPTLHNRLLFRSRQLGTTRVTVTAADLVTSTNVSFDFVVAEVTKALELQVAAADHAAIRLRNGSSQDIDFVLSHNGFEAFDSLADVVRFVRAMPEQFPGEEFDRKLWRFVRDSVYHDVPLSADLVQNEPWITLNSLGWGFCGNVAGTYVEIARAAGYEARVWGLSGHVVPEIRVDGAWRMFDPDLAVYYKDGAGAVAGVEELVQQPALIENPVNPIFAGSSYQFPYSAVVRDIYASVADNFDGETAFIAPVGTPSSRVVLPPRSILTYPGRWTEAPTGYDGDIAYTVRSFRQAMLELPDGYAGAVVLPWLLWDVQGDGEVLIDGSTFTAGSPELQARLRGTTAPITSLDVRSSASLRLIFMVNTVRYRMRALNRVALRGMNVWGIEVTADEALAEQVPVAGVAGAGAPDAVDEETYAKPLPTISAL